MSGFTDAAERAVLDAIFDLFGATLYLGLSSTTPGDDGSNFTEPSGGAYTRPATTAADWSAASATTPAVKTNTATINFPVATAAWLSSANLTWFGMFDALTVGNLRVIGEIVTPAAVTLGKRASFAPGALLLKLGDPEDTY